MVEVKSEPMIRDADPSDLAVIQELLRAMDRHYGFGARGDLSREEIERALFDPAEPFGVLLAEVENKTVGIAAYQKARATLGAMPSLRLDDLFVRPDYRRRGIAGALLSGVCGVAVREQLPEVAWTIHEGNEAATRFYRGIGAFVGGAVGFLDRTSIERLAAAA